MNRRLLMLSAAPLAVAFVLGAAVGILAAVGAAWLGEWVERRRTGQKDDP